MLSRGTGLILIVRRELSSVGFCFSSLCLSTLFLKGSCSNLEKFSPGNKEIYIYIYKNLNVFIEIMVFFPMCFLKEIVTGTYMGCVLLWKC